MSLLNNAMNAIGTIAALNSFFGAGPSSNAASRYGKFLAEIRENSISKTSLYEVTITPPRVMTTNPTAPKLSLYAHGAQLPGLFLQTSELKRYGVGPSEKIPYSLAVNDITLKFIGDGKGQIYRFFYEWMQNIVKADTSLQGEYSVVSQTGLAPFEVEFKENYKCQINIKTFDEQGETILSYDLIDAFPISIPEVELDWGEGAMMQFGITFNFFQSKLDRAADGATSRSGPRSLSPLQKLIKVGTAVQVLSSLRTPTSIGDAINVATNIKNVTRGF